MSRDPLDDFTVEEFTADGKTSPVYVTGSGPAVIVIAEIPGITPLVASFARRVAAAGCTVFVPSLFGVDGLDPAKLARPGTFADTGRAVGSLLRKVCVSREFTILATGRTSPVVSWLRALAREAHERCGGPGVGAIGMCLTGGFALAMAVDDTMIAPVLSQPSLPLRVVGNARNIDISDDDLARVKSRCAAGLQVMGLRFDGDPMVPAERFSYLRDQLGDAFIGIELPGSSANPDALLPVPHSVVTEQLIDEPGEPTREALDRVIAFFTDKLGVSA
ncbi:MAG TPA: dienelactone hydrolase family protein [Gordonia sp. (in: high G+C Gram-positive bacteria)]|uniref:dienelactone hydrolase family protein n=1 Tax=unclassified Gordonia (in: high G+C Gram-positive bacteria) TaxID=2657482 RepID=UPI000F957533|nr:MULTISPECIES: dienelactone hydrolase family protein [unclassified Gordonia (in: high G+C Gram-positive bacteria)]RUP35451.1 MAG: dienelactone hydrolase [Gordonia sp. (in: high G+C Gram-positive bacteria)]HNP57825.1 dienelactone hydrolase family protein [Gordonia sp. (in: high G+C Gram-positive bacteria)]HRC51284.1 dienelactone hydrolase family protein [Gordonia sp. (in: high G+C Gram-positive bacteria)]